MSTTAAAADGEADREAVGGFGSPYPESGRTHSRGNQAGNQNSGAGATPKPRYHRAGGLGPRVDASPHRNQHATILERVRKMIGELERRRLVIRQQIAEAADTEQIAFSAWNRRWGAKGDHAAIRMARSVGVDAAQIEALGRLAELRGVTVEQLIERHGVEPPTP